MVSRQHVLETSLYSYSYMYQRQYLHNILVIVAVVYVRKNERRRPRSSSSSSNSSPKRYFFQHRLISPQLSSQVFESSCQVDGIPFLQRFNTRRYSTFQHPIIYASISLCLQVGILYAYNGEKKNNTTTRVK